MGNKLASLPLDEIISKKSMLERELAEARQHIKSNFRKYAVEYIFSRATAITGFRWNQYTPYYCDGGACGFGTSIYEPELRLIGRDGYEMLEDILDGPTPLYSAEPLFDLVRGFLYKFSNDDYYNFFEDSAEITVTPKHLSVDYYEHD